MKNGLLDLRLAGFVFAPWLSAMGSIASVCVVASFLPVMHFLSGGE